MMGRERRRRAPSSALIGHACLLAGSLAWVALAVACLVLDRRQRPRQ